MRSLPLQNRHVLVRVVAAVCALIAVLSTEAPAAAQNLSGATISEDRFVLPDVRISSMRINGDLRKAGADAAIVGFLVGMAAGALLTNDIGVVILAGTAGQAVAIPFYIHRANQREETMQLQL